jgi:serine/threonine protein kinase
MNDAYRPERDPSRPKATRWLGESGADVPAGMGNAVPPRLARYEILEAVGEGATAVVYRARDRPLDRPVAVKVLKETAGPG